MTAIPNADPSLLADADPTLAEKYRLTVDRARNFITHYQNECGSSDVDEAATDLISDILLALNDRGTDVDEVLRSAQSHYLYESFQEPF